MAIKFPTIPTKRLAQSMSSTDMVMRLLDINTWGGVPLTPADLSDDGCWAALRDPNNTRLEIIEIDPATIASAEITILKRGLAYGGSLTDEDPDRQYLWTKGTLVELGTDLPQLFQYLKEYIDNIALAGAPDASLVAKGLVQSATSTQIDNGDATGSTGTDLSMRPDQFKASVIGQAIPTPEEKVFIAASTGFVLSYMGDTAPPGFVLADGATYDIATYPALAIVSKGKFGLGSLTSFTADNTTDTLTSNSHGMSDGDIIFLQNRGGTLPTGLSANTPYYVINTTINTFQVSLTDGGAPVDFTTNGSGTNQYSQQFKVVDLRGSTVIGAGQGVQKYTFDSDNGDVVAGPTSVLMTATDVDDWIRFNTPLNLPHGTPIYFSSGTIPGSLSLNTVYYLSPRGSLPSTDYYIATSRANLDAGVYIGLSNTSGQSGVLAHVGHFANSTLGHAQEVTVSTAGALPAGLSAGTYWTMQIGNTNGVYLATSRANAIAGTPVFITDDGSGIQTLAVTLSNRTVGETLGEEDVTLTESQIAPHRHGSNIAMDYPSGTGLDISDTGTDNANIRSTDSAGDGLHHNNMQPSVAMVKIIKT